MIDEPSEHSNALCSTVAEEFFDVLLTVNLQVGLARPVGQVEGALDDKHGAGPYTAAWSLADEWLHPRQRMGR